MTTKRQKSDDQERPSRSRREILDELADELAHLPALPEEVMANLRDSCFERSAEIELEAADLESPETSDSGHIARRARILAHAVEILESDSNARHWLEAPNRALGGQIPEKLLGTESGAREVEEILCRIEHGVFG